MREITTLWRPVGKKERELIEASGWTRFPPRLAIQPIFYPVLDREYAEQIALEWNTKDEASGFAGYVLEFDVDSQYLAQFPVQVVGAQRHRELWIPAEVLDEFNAQIIGPIRQVAEFLRADEP